MVRGLLTRLGLFAFTIVLFLAFAEIGLRLAFYHSKDFSMEMWKYAVQLKRPVDNPRLSFAHLPNGHAFLMGADVKINLPDTHEKGGEIIITFYSPEEIKGIVDKLNPKS